MRKKKIIVYTSFGVLALSASLALVVATTTQATFQSTSLPNTQGIDFENKQQSPSRLGGDQRSDKIAADIQYENIINVDGELDSKVVQEGWEVVIINVTLDYEIEKLSVGQEYRLMFNLLDGYIAPSWMASDIVQYDADSYYTEKHFRFEIKTAVEPNLQDIISPDGVLETEQDGWAIAILDPYISVTDPDYNNFIKQLSLGEEYHIRFELLIGYLSPQNIPNELHQVSESVYYTDVKTYIKLAAEISSTKTLSDYGGIQAYEGWSIKIVDENMSDIVTQISHLQKYYLQYELLEFYELPEGIEQFTKIGDFYYSSLFEFHAFPGDPLFLELINNDGTLNQDVVPKGWNVSISDPDYTTVIDALEPGTLFIFRYELIDGYKEPRISSLNFVYHDGAYFTVETYEYEKTVNFPNSEELSIYSLNDYEGWNTSIVYIDQPYEKALELQPGDEYKIKLELKFGYKLNPEALIPNAYDVISDNSFLLKEPQLYVEEAEILADYEQYINLLGKVDNNSLPKGWIVEIVNSETADLIKELTNGQTYKIKFTLMEGFTFSSLILSNLVLINGSYYTSTYYFQKNAALPTYETLITNSGTIDSDLVPIGWNVAIIKSEPESAQIEQLSPADLYKLRFELIDGFILPENFDSSDLTLDDGGFYYTPTFRFEKTVSVDIPIKIVTNEGILDLSKLPEGWSAKLIEAYNPNEIEKLDLEEEYRIELVLLDGYKLPTNLGNLTQWQDHSGQIYYYTEERVFQKIAQDLFDNDFINNEGAIDYSLIPEGWEVAIVDNNSYEEILQLDELGQSYLLRFNIKDGYLLPLDGKPEFLQNSPPNEEYIEYFTRVRQFTKHAETPQIEDLINNEGRIEESNIPEGWEVWIQDEYGIRIDQVIVGQLYQLEFLLLDHYFQPPGLSDVLTLDLQTGEWNTELKSFYLYAIEPQLDNLLNSEGQINSTLIPEGWSVKLVEWNSDQEIEILTLGTIYRFQFELNGDYRLASESENLVKDGNYYYSSPEVYQKQADALIIDDLVTNDGFLDSESLPEGWEVKIVELNLVTEISGQLIPGQSYRLRFSLKSGYLAPQEITSDLNFGWDWAYYTDPQTYIKLVDFPPTFRSWVNDDGTLDDSKTPEGVIVDIIEEVPSDSLSQGELYFLYIRFEDGYGLRSNPGEEEYVEMSPGVYRSGVSRFR